ncbi:MAG: rhamnulokinase [Christensenellales bacterium]|jgi:rhamnulokinase/L-fuculokinase|nr:hypothetical protein [Clostridiales bacterium]
MAKKVKKIRGYLAIDLGASSGRGIVGIVNKGVLEIDEVFRFENQIKVASDSTFWDLKKLEENVLECIKKACEKYEIESIGIDTWGVDYVYIGEKGKPLANPSTYRDPKTEGIIEKISKEFNLDELYIEAGIQHIEINTIFQIYADKIYRNINLSKAKSLALMPNYLAYFLTGKLFSEKTIASTTGLLSHSTKVWNEETCKKLGIYYRLPRIISPGFQIGILKKRIADEIGVKRIKVIAVCSHDTQSATMLIPVEKGKTAFLSCGTWSLFGVELDEAYIDISRQREWTNEQAFGDKINYLKNLTGLWILQQLRKQEIKKAGDKGIDEYTFEKLEKKARAEKPFTHYINTEDARFKGFDDVSENIKKYLLETGQNPIENIGQMVRAIYEGLAFQYRKALKEIENIPIGETTYGKCKQIYILGGGAQDKLLCQIIADVCQIEVVTGNKEATAVGNILVQLMSANNNITLERAKNLGNNMGESIRYYPNKIENIEQIVKVYEEITSNIEIEN